MEAIESLEMTLTEYEKQIVKACKAPLPRDVESLNSLVMNHKDFESNLHSHPHKPDFKTQWKRGGGDIMK